MCLTNSLNFGSLLNHSCLNKFARLQCGTPYSPHVASARSIFYCMCTTLQSGQLNLLMHNFRGNEGHKCVRAFLSQWVQMERLTVDPLTVGICSPCNPSVLLSCSVPAPTSRFCLRGLDLKGIRAWHLSRVSAAFKGSPGIPFPGPGMRVALNILPTELGQ